MMVNKHTRELGVHMSLFITKHVSIEMMLGRGNYILNLEEASVLLNLD